MSVCIHCPLPALKTGNVSSQKFNQRKILQKCIRKPWEEKPHLYWTLISQFSREHIDGTVSTDCATIRTVLEGAWLSMAELRTDLVSIWSFGWVRWLDGFIVGSPFVPRRISHSESCLNFCYFYANLLLSSSSSIFSSPPGWNEWEDIKQSS